MANRCVHSTGCHASGQLWYTTHVAFHASVALGKRGIQ